MAVVACCSLLVLPAPEANTENTKYVDLMFRTPLPRRLHCMWTVGALAHMRICRRPPRSTAQRCSLGRSPLSTT